MHPSIPRHPLLPAILLVGLTVVAYWPVTAAGFVWDDDAHISHNATLKSASGLRDIWLTPGTTMQYYPLTFTAWWIGYHVWGAAPLGFHLATLLLHITTSFLLWLVLATILPTSPGQTHFSGAWLGAMIFALHPVNVMSVAWATELKNTLSGSLALGACWAYLRFAGIAGDDARSLGPRTRWRFYALSLVLFLLALLAKTAVCLLPATLLLIVWWKKDGAGRADLLSLAPMGLLAAGTGVITVYVEHHSGGAVGREFTVPYLERLLVSGRSFWFYLGKLLVPHPLSFIYDRWEIEPRRFAQWLFPAATAALLAILFLLRRRIGKGPLVAALHYFLATSGLIFVVVTYMTRYTWVSDHWQYYGAMSATAIGGAGIANLVARNPRGSWVTWASGALLLALGAMTFRQTFQYHDLETLLRTTIETSPRAWMAISNMGTLRMHQARYADAIPFFDRALEINPDNEETYNNRANVYLQLGDSRRAVADSTRAIELFPDMAEGHTIRAMAYAYLKEYERAVTDYARAIELRPGSAELVASRGTTYCQLLKYDLAVADFTRAIELKPDFADAYTNRGVAYLSAGRPDLAIADQTQALAIAPSAVRFRNRGLAESRIGRCEDAVRDLDHAIEMNDRYTGAYLDRAKCLFRLKLDDRARADVRKLVELGGGADEELLALLQRPQ